MFKTMRRSYLEIFHEWKSKLCTENWTIRTVIIIMSIQDARCFLSYLPLILKIVKCRLSIKTLFGASYTTLISAYISTATRLFDGQQAYCHCHIIKSTTSFDKKIQSMDSNLLHQFSEQSFLHIRPQ